MIRETKCYMTYPNKSITEDLITRDGPATDDDFSPFLGRRKETLEQFSGTQAGRYRESDFIAYSARYDLNPAKINVKSVQGLLVEFEGTVGILKTLEDVVMASTDIDHAYEYLKDQIVGYKKNNSSPYRKNREFLTYTKKNYESDDDVYGTEEKYLLVRDGSDLDNEELEEILRELPYVMKSIWTYSKLYQANLFTFALAFWDILQTKRRNPIINDFANYRTQLISRDGKAVRDFDHGKDNKYTIYPKVTKIFIAPGSHQAEFNLCYKWLSMISRLGINYKDEDGTKYNNDLIDKIICTYIPSNEQYFNDYKDVDIEIMVALKPENILSTAKSGLYSPPEQEEKFNYRQMEYFVSDRIDFVRQLREMPYEFFNDHIDDSMYFLDEILSIMNGKKTSVPRHLISFEYNGLMYMNKEILTIPGYIFGTFRGREDYNVAFTRYGFIVALEESFDELYYMTIEDCVDAIERYKEYGRNNEKGSWKIL